MVISRSSVAVVEVAVGFGKGLVVVVGTVGRVVCGVPFGEVRDVRDGDA